MTAAETVRQALPDEFCLEFWGRGLRSDGRGLRDTRPLTVDVLGPAAFAVALGDNACAGSYALGRQRPRVPGERIIICVEEARRGERGLEPLIDVFLATLHRTFAAQLPALGPMNIEVRLHSLLEDGNCAVALFLCCELCVAAALAAAKVPLAHMPLLGAQLFCIVWVAGREFTLTDPTADEKSTLRCATAEVLCLWDEEGGVSLVTLRAGEMSVEALQQTVARAPDQPSQFAALRAALSSAADAA